MARSYLAFDLEIVKPIPSSTADWKAFRPLGISCAATVTDGDQLTVWHGEGPDGDVGDQMTPSELAGLVHYLQDATESGFTLLSWNGLGFDFDILAEESGLGELCKSLAWDHVDMMFHIFCLKGFALGLDRAAKGMGLSGKPFGMTGDLAPKYWAQGRRGEVLEYVAQDARTTIALAGVVEREGGLSWTSSRGRPQYQPLKDGWLTVRKAADLPLPDTSWMRNPWSRSKFLGWLHE